MNTGPDWPAVLQLQGICAAIYDTIIPRRERIATAALQGLLAAIHNVQGWPSRSSAARMAVEYADALIAELDKEQKG